MVIRLGSVFAIAGFRWVLFENLAISRARSRGGGRLDAGRDSIRFLPLETEQRTMFFRVPSGNPIEVKGFEDFDGVFAS